MLASFKAPTLRRGTQILRATSPRGPFTPLTDQPITPRDWDCLDGTLYLDPSDQPWMVFWPRMDSNRGRDHLRHAARRRLDARR